MLKKIFAALSFISFRKMRIRKEGELSPVLREAVDLFEAGRYQEVVDCCRELIYRGNSQARTYHLCGRALIGLGRYREALDCYEAAVRRAPAIPEILLDLARARNATGDTLGAVKDYRSLQVLQPEMLDYRLELIEVLERAGMTEELVTELLIAQDMASHRTDLLYKTFTQVSRIGMKAEALRIAERARNELGEGYDTYRILAAARYGCADMSGAVEACRRALTFRSDQPDLYVTLGSSLFALGQTEDAVSSYRRALELDPDHPDGVFHMGLVLLMQGRYREGWDGFERRFKRGRNRAMRLDEPVWDGAPLSGRGLLVLREQGLGDEIMFASCYQQVIDLAGDVIFECEPRLEKLFSRSFPKGHFLPKKEGSEDLRKKVSVSDRLKIYSGSLPGFYRNELKDFPDHQGYLRPDPARVGFWNDRISSLGPGLKVGISWRGGSAFTHSERRSILLSELQSLLCVPGIHWVNLQYGNRSEEIATCEKVFGIAIADWPEAIDGDYDETAALVCALDLVISVCTSVVHLAGALGKTGWVMTAKVPEWRYGLKGSKMPWYPSLTLFRQQEQGVWRAVIAEVECELRQFLVNRTP